MCVGVGVHARAILYLWGIGGTYISRVVLRGDAELSLQLDDLGTQALDELVLLLGLQLHVRVRV